MTLVMAALQAKPECTLRVAHDIPHAGEACNRHLAIQLLFRGCEFQAVDYSRYRHKRVMIVFLPRRVKALAAEKPISAGT